MDKVFKIKYWLKKIAYPKALNYRKHYEVERTVTIFEIRFIADKRLLFENACY